MVRVRYFAAARAAAGVEEEVSEAPTLAELRDRLTRGRDERLARVLSVSSFLVDGVAWHEPHEPLPSGATVDVLPPFAGG